MRAMRNIISPLAAVWLLSTPVAAQRVTSEALLEGTWELDLSRSQFIEIESPRRQVMTFEPGQDGEGMQATVVFTSDEGVERRVSYVMADEGEEIPLQGQGSFDTITLRSQGPYEAVALFTHAGQVVGRAERSISMDGREMTVVVERNGNISSRAIFVKQEE